ncbi:hypothetical protein D3C81_2278090 [compost metagenome]
MDAYQADTSTSAMAQLPTFAIGPHPHGGPSHDGGAIFVDIAGVSRCVISRTRVLSRTQAAYESHAWF